MEEHYLPRYLHARPQLLNWELDELMFFIPFVGIGIMVGKMPLFSVIGYVVMKIYIRLKNSKQDGYVIHFFYKLGLYNLKDKFPEYWIKELVK